MQLFNAYAIADRLGMLVCDVLERMTLAEYHGWLAYLRETEPK